MKGLKNRIEVFLFFLIFKIIFIFEREREREYEQGRGRERETESMKQAPGSEPSAQSPTRGWNPRTARS